MNEQKQTFPSKKQTKIIIGIVVLVILYFGFIGPYLKTKNECRDKVRFKPAGTYDFGGGMESEYFVVGTDKFKTAEDAVRHCMLQKD